MTSHKSRYERHADYRRAFRLACEEHPELLIATCLSFTSKIGPKSCVKTLNLPPRLTCRRKDLVIASPICRARCYGHKMMEWPSVEHRAENNLRLTKLATFADILTCVILKTGPTHVKLHAMGDFYDPKYIDDVVSVITNCEDVTFWSYTRGWRMEAFVPGLTRLAALPNMNLLLSHDRKTGTPPAIPHTQLAWLADNDDEPPTVPSLIAFRATKEDTILTSIGGTMVCPHQNGKPSPPKGCVTCGICLCKGVGEQACKEGFTSY